MAQTLSILWTVVPEMAPRPWLHCSRCGENRPFRSTGKFRLNANGKCLDAWLIYGCVECGQTWKRTILKRQGVATLEPSFLAALQANDLQLARRIALDTDHLRQPNHRHTTSGPVLVEKMVLSPATAPSHHLEIRLVLPVPCSMRLDRLLARELGITRLRLRRLQLDGRLAILPEYKQALKKPPRDAMRIILDLSSEDDAKIIAAQARGSTALDPP